MLSYQHAYHAGHAADIAKHALLAALLHHLTRKPAPLTCLETHAGRGTYPLDLPEMQKTRAYESGFLKILPHRPSAPGSLAPFFSLFPEYGTLESYPGSPAVAKALLRPQDDMQLFELHPTEVSQLRQFAKGDARIRIHAQDGHQHLPNLLPTQSNRAVVLIDPSYEVKTEYLQTAQTAHAILQKAPKTIVMVWYPLLPASRHAELVQAVTALKTPATWQAEYQWQTPQPDAERQGAYGTGFLLLNTPYQLDKEFTEILHWLAPRLVTAGEMPHLATRFLHPPV